MNEINQSSTIMSDCCIQEEPRDFTIKRKFRQVPPPLDLSKRNLEPDEITALVSSPRSPFLQKNLPLRKRAYSWSSQPENLTNLHTLQNNCYRNVVHENEIKHYTNHHNTSIVPPSSSAISLKYDHDLPTPYTPHTPQHPHSAIPVITSRFNFGENLSDHNNSTRYQLQRGGIFSSTTQCPLNLSTTSVGALPSSLLSPAPSHPSSSSLNSSREELEPEPTLNTPSFMESHNNYVLPQSSRGKTVLYSATTKEELMIDESDNFISSTNNTITTTLTTTRHMTTSHHWPTTVWSVFLTGVQVHFVLGAGQYTKASFSEDLGQLERNHQQQYAPHGLHLLKTIIGDQNNSSMAQKCQLYFRPVAVQQEDIMVIAPVDHPFYVKEKGWCSILVDQARERYSIPCQQLIEGDLCLPPNHPELTHTNLPVVTPDLTDAMKRFDFSEENCENAYESISAPPSATLLPPHRSIFLSPPSSPSKKNISGVRPTPMNVVETPSSSSAVATSTSITPSGSNGGSKSRRPMNGFMLFAKHHRLKLIQQYPGKDNRAISVLLGAMWKALPDEDRERFNCEARLQAEERKRLDPDCWKRKRSHSTS